MRVGLIAGSIAAIAAALVSLPLRSPNDLLFNSATVSAAAIALGIAAGAAWTRLADTRRPTLYFSLLPAAGLIVLALAALLLETFLERSFTFAVPLAATALILIGVLIPLLGRGSVAPNRWTAPALLVIAAAVGGEAEAPAAGVGEATLGLRIVPGQERNRHRRFQVGQEAVDAVGPECAVAAALPHVVDREESLGVPEQVAQPDFAGERPQRIVRDLPARGRPSRRVQPGGEFGDLLLECFDICLGGFRTCMVDGHGVSPSCVGVVASMPSTSARNTGAPTGSEWAARSRPAL